MKEKILRLFYKESDLARNIILDMQENPQDWTFVSYKHLMNEKTGIIIHYNSILCFIEPSDKTFNHLETYYIKEAIVNLLNFCVVSGKKINKF